MFGFGTRKEEETKAPKEKVVEYYSPWEHHEGDSDTFRMKTPGGWLVGYNLNTLDGGCMAFVPDPEHKWDWEADCVSTN